MLKKIGSYSIILCWVLICIASFINGPGRRSGIHLFPLKEQSLKTIFTQIVEIDFQALIIDTMKAFTGASLFVLSAIGLGWIILKYLNKNAVTTDEELGIIPTSFVIGQSLFSLAYLVLLVGFKHFSLLSITFLFIIGLFFFFFLINDLIQYLRKGFKNFIEFSRGSKISLLAIVLILSFGSALLYSSSRLSYDAASQYFAQSKMIAHSEQLNLLAFKDAFVGSALYLISLQSALIKLFGDQAARMYSWMNGVVILTFVIMIGERLGISTRARLLFLPIAMTSTAYIDLLGDGKIELISTGVVLASVYWFIRSLQKPSIMSFFLASFLGGYAVVSRPYNVILLGPFVLLLSLFYIWSAKQRYPYLHALTHSSFIILPPLLVWGISFLLVNSLLYGNPLAPMSILELGINEWPIYHTGFLKNILISLYPLVITFWGAFDTPGLISPFFLAFLPLFLIKETRDLYKPTTLTFFFFVSAIVVLYLWIVLFGSVIILEVRYVLFIWLLLFLPVAQLVDNTMRISSITQVVIQAVLIILLLFMTVRTTYISLATYSPIDQNDSSKCDDLPMCSFFEPVNRIAHPGDRVLVLSPYRYYLRPDLFACSSTREEYIELAEASRQGPGVFWEEVNRQGYRYILYDSFYNQYILRFQSLPDLDSSLPPGGVVLYNSVFNDYDRRTITESIYQIELSSSELPNRICKLNDDKWQVQSR